MTFRFLHLADLHLDSAYGGRAETRARLRLATMEALERAASFAIRGELDAVLIAGDAFDDGRLGYDARALLRREVARLGGAGVTVVYATGNHDPGGPAFAATGLRLGAGAGPGAAPVHVALDGSPRTWPVLRAGSPVATVTACGHDTSAVEANLARSMRAPATRSIPHVAVLHTQVGSARGAEGHARYAPSGGADLQHAGFAYWALGHVHVRGRADEHAPAWYCGNLQGRSPRETGPKGGLLVEVDASGLVRPPEFVPFAPVEFMDVRVANDAGGEPEDVATAVRDAIARELGARGGLPAPAEAVVRATLTGRGGATPQAELDDPARRAAFEDAVRQDPQLEGLGVAVLEVQLRCERELEGAEVSATTGRRSAGTLERDLAGAPSALREALRIADELERDPSLADDWTLHWASGSAGGSDGGVAARRARVAALGRGLRAEILRRASESASAAPSASDERAR